MSAARLTAGLLPVILAACGQHGGAAGGAPAAPSQAARALLATLPPAYGGADLDNGEAKFAACRSCHSATRGGGNMTGPNLWGVFGRKAGVVAGFHYSDGVKASGIVWDAASLDKWIANPRAVAPDTKMSFVGIDDAKDRRDLIAYLKVASSVAR